MFMMIACLDTKVHVFISCMRFIDEMAFCGPYICEVKESKEDVENST